MTLLLPGHQNAVSISPIASLLSVPDRLVTWKLESTLSKIADKVIFSLPAARGDCADDRGRPVREGPGVQPVHEHA